MQLALPLSSRNALTHNKLVRWHCYCHGNPPSGILEEGQLKGLISLRGRRGEATMGGRVLLQRGSMHQDQLLIFSLLLLQPPPSFLLTADNLVQSLSYIQSSTSVIGSKAFQFENHMMILYEQYPINVGFMNIKMLRHIS